MQLEGVYSVQEPHFWTLCSDIFVGMIKLEVAAKADAKYIQSQTHNIFMQVCILSASTLLIALLQLTYQLIQSCLECQHGLTTSTYLNQ